MNNDLFKKNLNALQRFDSLFISLLNEKITYITYKSLKSSSGDIIPVFIDSDHALHSLVDPHREAKRIINTLTDEGFIVVLGMGGAYLIEAALERKETSFVLVIDYNIDGISELLCFKDYTKIFNDPRFHILIDADDELIGQFILNHYKPALYGSLSTLLLKSRTNSDIEKFNNAVNAIEQTIKTISQDYSVQAYFGTVWFSNIIRNLIYTNFDYAPHPLIKHAAITAAGPSLNFQISEIRERREEFFLLATDTSLPCLILENIYPDAVVSIDCQHVGYHHFMSGLPETTDLFLDLASPPLIASQSLKPYFFSGNHPLTGYINKFWRSVPEIDTSGGNITYSSIALAEKLGAETIELFGADFSYPKGLTYAKGSYVHPYFEKKQNRTCPLESLNSTFLYRTPLIKKNIHTSWYYENASLSFYREKLEAKTKTSDFKLIHKQGWGAPIKISSKSSAELLQTKQQENLFKYGKCQINAADFLADYRKDILSLPVSGIYNEKEKNIFTTLLPAAAALRRRSPELNTENLLEKTKEYCIKEIDKVLSIYTH